MRAAAVTLLLTGCLSEPAGKPQVWPPPNLDVVSADAADLDDDGADELVVLSAGAAADGAGVYVLHADGETFDDLAALDVGRPAQVLIADLEGDAHPEILVVADGDDDLVVTALDGDLTPRATAEVGTFSVSDDGRVHLFLLPYPQGLEVVVLAADTARRAHADDFVAGGAPDFEDLDPIGVPISDADLAVTHHDNAMDEWTVMLAGPSQISKNTLGPSGLPEASWRQIRSGALWPQQAAVALDSGPGQRIDIVGVDTMPTRAVCAHDLYAELPIACSPVGTVPLDHRAIEVADLVSGNGPDLIILGNTPGGGVPVVVPNLGLEAVGGPITHDAPVIWDGAPFDAWAFATVDDQLVLVDPDGTLTCLTRAGGALVAC